nr:Bro-N domain-containing protein [Acidocella facilis]
MQTLTNPGNSGNDDARLNVGVTPFDFQGRQVRIVTREGNPWFVAADVCRALGIQIMPSGEPNVTVALRKLGGDERALYPIQGRHHRVMRANFISESGLYKLVMRSDKPEARQFQDWVTREVLPAIRKDGMYVKGEEKVRTGELSEDELTLMVMQRLQAKVERLKDERDELAAKVDTMQPKAEVADRLTSARGAKTVTEASKALNVNARELVPVPGGCWLELSARRGVAGAGRAFEGRAPDAPYRHVPGPGG